MSDILKDLGEALKNEQLRDTVKDILLSSARDSVVGAAVGGAAGSGAGEMASTIRGEGATEGMVEGFKVGAKLGALSAGLGSAGIRTMLSKDPGIGSKARILSAFPILAAGLLAKAITGVSAGGMSKKSSAYPKTESVLDKYYR